MTIYFPAPRPITRICVKSTPQNALRSIGYTTSLAKALPFYLHDLRAGATSRTDNYDSKVLRMLMFGKPGAGKGTLTSWLVRKYDILSLSTGDLLRQHIAEKRVTAILAWTSRTDSISRTNIGRQAEHIVARGGLVSDDIMLQVVTNKLDALRNKVGTTPYNLLTDDRWVDCGCL